MKSNLSHHRNAFKDRKASNRVFSNDLLTPQNIQYMNKFSRNYPQNISHTMTQYSPASYKDYNHMTEVNSIRGIRGKRSRNRMIPSQSYGPGFKIHSKFSKPYNIHPQKPHGLYTPLVMNYQDPRFSTFDNEYYEEESDQEMEPYEMDTYEEMMDLPLMEDHQQRLMKVMDDLQKTRIELNNQSRRLHKNKRRVLKSENEVALQRQENAAEKLRLERMEQSLKESFEQLKLKQLKIAAKEKLLKKTQEQIKRAGMKQTNSNYFKGLDIEKDDRSNRTGIINTYPDSELIDENDSQMAHMQNQNMQYNNYQQVEDHHEDPQNIQKRYAEDYDVNQRDYESQLHDDNYQMNEEASQHNEFPKSSSRNLNSEFQKNASRNVSVS